MTHKAERPRVALLVTCLVDMFRPSVGFGAVKLLEDAGCEVHVPAQQTCCGQPAWNSGDRETAKAIATQVIEAFEGYDYVVVPSGSCGATLAKDYPEMFRKDDAMRPRAEALSAKTHEIISFLADVRGVTGVKVRLDGSYTYHDSCSGLRSLGIHDQPRALLASVEGLELREMHEANVCCGFGGTFCVKYPEVSSAMVGDKTRNATDTGADLLLAGDLGCLMNMAGKMSREGHPMKARHIVEVLAGMTDIPAIGEDRS
jgi:L-lactate dehydrogenase complex protein LldE